MGPSKPPGLARVRAAAAKRAEAPLAADVSGWLDLKRPSGILEICGEPWIGKTRLLHQIINSLGRRGWSAAHAAAGPPSGALPFQLFSHAFEESIAKCGDMVLDTMPAGYRPGLDMLFPAFGRGWRHDLPSLQRSELAGQALREIIPRLQGPAGLVLALDNVHWADPASIDLLESLLRRPPAARLRIIVVHRNRQSSPRLRGLLAATPGRWRIELRPLPDTELAALLPARLSRSQRRSVLSRADGNPGLLLALSASLPVSMETSPESSGLDPFAPYLEEFRGVSAEGWVVAQSAAVLGDGFTLDEMRQLTRIDDGRFGSAFDELMREDILRTGEVAGTYRFRHQLLRSAAYYSASERWRLNAHAAAVTFARVPTSCSHPVTGPRPCPAWGTDRVRSGLLPQAAGAAASHEACLYNKRIRTGKALIVAGRPAEALDVLDRTTRTGDSVSAIARAEAAEWRTRAQRLLGRHTSVESYLAAVRADIEPEPEAIALLDLAGLAAELERGGPLRETRSWATCWAAGQRDPLTRAYAQALLGAWDADMGRVESANSRLRESAAMLDQLGDTDLIGRLDALYWLARAQARLEQDGAAARRFEHGLGIAGAYELEYLIPQFATGLAESSLRLGRIDVAFDAGRQAARAADRIGSDFLAAEAQAILARVAWVSGDRATAKDAARCAAERAGAWREPWADKVRLTVLETILDANDQWPGEGILSAGTLRRAAVFPVVAQIPAIGEVLARVESVRSEPSIKTARWADAAEKAASQMRLPGAIGLALLARAHHYRVADPLAAAAFAASAVVALTRAGRLLDVARAHLTAAAAWTVLSDAAVASTQLTDAQILLDECGAHGYLEQAAQLTAHVTRQTANVRLTLLSGREREIATLVSDGRTNQQIARVLRLSHKTVETHLSRIFRKLDVNSRAQVAASIGRASMGWTPQFSGDRPV